MSSSCLLLMSCELDLESGYCVLKHGVRIELKLLDRFNFQSNPWQNFSPQKPLTSQNPSPGKAGNVVSPDSASPLNWPKRTLPCR